MECMGFLSRYEADYTPFQLGGLCGYYLSPVSSLDTVDKGLTQTLTFREWSEQLTIKSTSQLAPTDSKTLFSIVPQWEGDGRTRTFW